MPDFAELFQAVQKVTGPLKVDSRAVVKLVPSTPRRRGAVVVHDGFAALETYQAVRPKLFAGSLVVALGATGMAWWRRRNGTEAIGSWSMLAAFAAGVAYLTRPEAGTGKTVTGPTATDRAYAWLDARAARLDVLEPGWEEKTVNRVLG